MKILRPTMISVLKENTKGLTHMNRETNVENHRRKRVG